MRIRDRIGPITRAEGRRGTNRLQWVVPVGLRRWLPSVLLVVAAIAVIASTQSDGDGGVDVDVENMWAAVAFLLFIAGATAWVWRKARGEGLEALRWRRLHRRVFWRAAAVCLLGSMVALWFDAFWQWRADNSLDDAQLPVWLADTAHARFFSASTPWLALAAVPLVAIEPFAWRLWPKAMRVAAQRARVVKVLAEGDRLTQLEVDPGLGAVGRPQALAKAAAREPSGEKHCITPKGRRPIGWTRAASDLWWRNAAITWDGAALVLTDGQGRSRVFPVAGRPRTAGGNSADVDGRRLVTEIVWFVEERYYRRTSTITRTRPIQQALLLDAEGRRIAEMPAVGFTADDLADVARSSGLPFAAYHLGRTWEDQRPVNRLLFPRTRRTVTIPARQRVRGKE